MKKFINLIKYWLKINPSWKKCVHASCWDGSTAQRRMMNILSPRFSDAKFEEYVKWMESRGCDTAHVFFGNGGDGEGAGYYATDNVRLTEKRIKYLRLHGFAVVPWLMADDSSAFAKSMFRNPDGYVKSFADAGLFDHASCVVLGLEMNEYGGAAQWVSLRDAVRKYCPKLRIGVHHTSGRVDFAAYADILFYQVDPGKSAAQIRAETARALSTGKPVNFFELSRHDDRALAQAALDAGAFGVGNW